MMGFSKGLVTIKKNSHKKQNLNSTRIVRYEYQTKRVKLLEGEFRKVKDEGEMH